MILSRGRIVAGLAVFVFAMTATPGRGETISVIGTVGGNGYTFTNFDGPTPNGGGTTINGISNNGTVVGFSADSAGNLTNFTASPLTSTTATLLNLSTPAMANGINSSSTVVGFDGISNVFSAERRESDESLHLRQHASHGLRD